MELRETRRPRSSSQCSSPRPSGRSSWRSGSRTRRASCSSSTPIYVFSPNGDGRLDRARVTFKVKKADDVTVEIVDSDGDPVRTLLDDRHLDAYAPIKPALRWDGTDDDGQVVPDGRYRVRITLRHLGRSVFPQRSILKDTKPPQPKVLSIGPTKVYGPELLPGPEDGNAEVHFGPALGRARDPRLPHGAGRAARGADRPAARGPDPVGLGRHRRRRAARLAGHLRRRARVARRGRQHRHVRAAGAARGCPCLTHGHLPGRGGITVRYLGAQVPVTPAKARDRVEIQVDARRQRYSWNVRRIGDPAVRAHSSKPKTKTKVVFSAPGGKSGSTS